MKLLSIFFLALCSFFIVGCDAKSKDQMLIVGTSADNPPYEFIQNGQVVGFDIDLINAIGEKLGKKVIIKNYDFNGLIVSLTSENVDMVIAGLSLIEERKKHINFSIPYTVSKVSILYRSEDNIESTGDLHNKVVGVQLGTTLASIVQDISKQFNIRISYLSNNLMLVEELKSKVVDAVMLDELQAKRFIENNPGLASLSLKDMSSEFAIAMPKNSNLVDSVNKAITELTKDDTISSIAQKWLQQ